LHFLETSVVASEIKEALRRLRELLEANRQRVTIRKILIPPRPVDHVPDDPFEPEFEKPATVDFKQPDVLVV
jgi:hypothetical protein